MMKRREFMIKSGATGLSLGLMSACGGIGSEGNSGETAVPPGGKTPTNGTPIGTIESVRNRMPAYSGPNPFQHGIASGDPLAHQVILWTRITAEGLDEIPVIVEVARDSKFQNIVYEGVGYARSQSDFTVKIDPLLPSPQTTYYYRFESLGYVSTIGRTRTTPAPSQPVDHVRLALVSCSSYSHGYFNAYRKVAFRADLDAVVHLGDYIYEYGPGEYEDDVVAAERPIDPPHEILTLADYRRRYACYRQDGDLQECHRQHPFICVWDDHEIANDTWKDGAGNHNNTSSLFNNYGLGEGSFAERKRAAVRAYFEWMPIRRVDPDDNIRIYRHFEFGQLMSLMMLDTRLIGRDKQPEDGVEARDRERQLLGASQERWLFEQLEQSRSRGARWHLIGQQVMMAPLTLGTLPDMPNWSAGGGIQFNFDQWDGYETSRRNLLGRIDAMGLDNAVVLTGDIHSSWAMDLSLDPGNPAVYNPLNGSGSLAVEFVTPAMTSPGLPSQYLSDMVAATLVPINPHIKWLDWFHRGYVVLDITPEHCKADWFHLETVTEPSNQETFARAYVTENGANHVSRSDTPSAPKLNPPALAPATQTVTESAK